MENFLYGLAVALGLILAYLFGKRGGDDGRGTLDRVDDALDSAGDDVGEVADGLEHSIEQLEDVSDAVAENEQRLADDIERVDDIQSDIGQGAERLGRIKEIVAELQKRHDHSGN